MSGVAQRVQGYTGLKNYAGVWETQVVDGISWFVLRPDKDSERAAGGPSWSWATSRGELFHWDDRFYARYDFYLDKSIQVLDVGIQYTGRDTDGMVTAGVITLNALLGTLDLTSCKLSKSPGEMIEKTVGITCDVEVFWDRAALKGEPLSSHLCLRLGDFPDRRLPEGKYVKEEYVAVLILAPCGTDTDGHSEYERSGSALLKREFWEQCETWRETIRLV
ncbi:hypothetical protein ACHAPT_009008 [Fusarium lateritium]